ncbi:MAG: GGDEF domain-containing protein [Pseudomonadota bacterium]
MSIDDYENLLKENAELKKLIGQFKGLLDSIPDPVFMKDDELRWIYGNPVILNLYQIDKNNYIGKTEDQLLPAEFAESCMESDRNAVAARTVSKSEERARTEDDVIHYYEVFKVPFYDGLTGEFHGLIGVGRDITDRKYAQEALEIENRARKENEEKLAHLTATLEQKVSERTAELQKEMLNAELLARTDVLTGMRNRRAFFENSQVIDKQARRHHRIYSVVVIDIDLFKKINDTHGHAIGDMAIQQLAEIINRNLRVSDVEGRIGGEEFALTLPETAINEAMEFAERLRAEISKNTIHFEDGEITLTASFGVAEFQADSVSFDDILAKADKALFQAKTNGRNQVMFAQGVVD